MNKVVSYILGTRSRSGSGGFAFTSATLTFGRSGHVPVPIESRYECNR